MESPSIHFFVIVLLVLLSIVAALILSVLLYGLFTYRLNRKKLQWSQVIDQELSQAIVSGLEDLEPHPEIQLLLKKKRFRAFYLEKLVKAESKFSGTASSTLKALLEKYGLEEGALKKLKSRDVFLIAGGIQELTTMKVEKSRAQLAPLLLHPSRVVYQEAQYAEVSFRGFEGLGFLNKTTAQLSEWQQLRLLNSVPSIPEEHGGEINAWLSSSNPSVVDFTLRLIRKFQLLTYYFQVVPLFEHPNYKVRIQAFRTLQGLENSSTLDLFISKFESQPIELQVELLKQIRRMDDPRSEPFFHSVLLSHTFSSVKIQAAQGLFELGKTELLESVKSTTEDPELHLIVKHALKESA